MLPGAGRLWVRRSEFPALVLGELNEVNTADTHCAANVRDSGLVKVVAQSLLGHHDTTSACASPMTKGSAW
jgi:hypothetical protein